MSPRPPSPPNPPPPRELGPPSHINQSKQYPNRLANQWTVRLRHFRQLRVPLPRGLQLASVRVTQPVLQMSSKKLNCKGLVLTTEGTL